MNTFVTSQGLFEKLTQAVYLDRMLKIIGVAGFVVTYLNAWRGLSFFTKAGFLLSVAVWFVGARFSRIYR